MTNNDGIRTWRPVKGIGTIKRWVMGAVRSWTKQNGHQPMSVIQIHSRICNAHDDRLPTLGAVDWACRVLVGDAELYPSINSDGISCYGLKVPKPPELGKELTNVPGGSEVVQTAILGMLGKYAEDYPEGMQWEVIFSILTRRSTARPDVTLYVLSPKRLSDELYAMLMASKLVLGWSEKEKAPTYRLCSNES